MNNWDFWESKSFDPHLSEDFIREHANDLNWNTICRNSTLSESFIEEMVNRVNWAIICDHQYLSEPFIRKWLHKFSLDKVFEYQKVSESFIREVLFPLRTKGRWDDYIYYLGYVVGNQILSKDFIREISRDLDESRYELLIYKNMNIFNLAFVEELGIQWRPCVTNILTVNRDFVERWKENIDWKGLTRTHLFTDTFTDKYARFIDWDEFVLNQGVNDEDRFNNWFWEKYDDIICKYQLHHTNDYYTEYEGWKEWRRGVRVL